MGDSIQNCHFCSCQLSFQASYISDIVLSQFGRWVVRTNHDLIPTSLFGCHVYHVVCLSTKKQMTGPYACRVVAFMTDKQPLWDRAISKCPSEAMHSVKNVMYPYLSISQRISISSPFPASWSLFHFGPNSICDGNITVICLALIRTINPFRNFQVTRPDKKINSTLLTSSWNTSWSWHNHLLCGFSPQGECAAACEESQDFGSDPSRDLILQQ